jgi:hypothetical protein
MEAEEGTSVVTEDVVHLQLTVADGAAEGQRGNAVALQPGQGPTEHLGLVHRVHQNQALSVWSEVMA